MSNKEKELKKYIDKKKKQKLRDTLMEEICAINKDRKENKRNKIKKVKRVKLENDDFEQKLFEANGSVNEQLLFKSEDDKSAKIFDETESNFSLQKEGNLDINPAINNDYISANQEPNIDKICFDNGLDLDCVLPESSGDLKKKIIDLNENFEIKKCEKRTSEIQEQRKKMDIFYSESEIVSLIKYNLIVFVHGMTGCGKTTQIPQFLYENGFTSDKIIGITQPRRISAVSIASRLNTEMNEEIAGYKIKYENNLTENTRIKVMTEGILFREIQQDFFLNKYSVIILDEVHERTSNMDILIGFLSKIVKLRFEMCSPLRLVLMSATVDSNDFKHVLGDFCTLNLTSKSFKVNVYYEPKTSQDYLDESFKKIKDILNAEDTRKSSKKKNQNTVDIPNTIENDHTASILVFLPSKENIYTLKERLESIKRDIVVLPLHSSLSKLEQNKVFQTYDCRKVILATNIAETSITIDDIVYVVDSGRVKRRIMDQNTVMYKVDFISKSSAMQRMGRAGRTRPGACFRIYSGNTYEAFESSEIPQILIEPFNSNFLQLKNIGIKNIFEFPFITLPTDQIIKDTLESLEDIGALDTNGNITSLGKSMCKFPVQPRYSRLLLLKDAEDVFYLMSIIVSILSSSFELRKNENTRKYFVSEKSDLVASLKIFVDFLRAEKQLKFCRSVGMPYEVFQDIKKMSYYLMKIANRSNFSIQLGELQIDKICKCLYYGFSDQLALNNGSVFIYKNGEVSISNDSIETDAKKIVFDSIVCGNSKSYLKNITVVPDN